MDEYVLAAQEQLLPLLNEGAVRTVITRTPGGYGASDDFNSGAITVFLKPWEEREKTTQDVVDEVNRRLATLPAVRGNAAVRSSLGRGRGQPINFVIAGSTYEDLVVASDRDRKSVVAVRSVFVRVDLGGRRINKKKRIK